MEETVSYKKLESIGNLTPNSLFKKETCPLMTVSESGNYGHIS